MKGPQNSLLPPLGFATFPYVFISPHLDHERLTCGLLWNSFSCELFRTFEKCTPPQYLYSSDLRYIVLIAFADVL
ncbi:unnamed protein product [Leptosia nina]|uniref:Uncharacterized protein n=1 Tax=Leptosia nina TaxID=320188 RepID=A0AAV1J3G5_9NEOP